MKNKNRQRSQRGIQRRRAHADQAKISAIFNKAVTNHQLGNLPAATAGYRRVLKIQHDNPDALNLLGVARNQLGDNAAAIDLIRRAIDIAPDAPMFHYNAGCVLSEIGRNAEALVFYQRAVELDPSHIEARTGLGNTLVQLGQADRAIAALEDTIGRAPESADAHSALALALLEKANFEQAGVHFRRAAALDPASPTTHYNLGNYYYQMKMNDAAIEALRQAIAFDPHYAEAYGQLGAALRMADLQVEALAPLKTALRLNPQNANTWLTLAATHRDLRQLNGAHEAVLKAIEINPALAEAQNELGYILRSLGRYDEAIAAYSTASKLDPDHPFAVANRAYVDLADGRFVEGWRDYRGRATILRIRDQLFQDRLPDDLSGKRILLFRDQGLGDQIFFLRFGPWLKNRNAHVTYRGERKILSIIEHVPTIDAVIDEEKSETLPGSDYRISVGDLPYATGMTDVSDIPPPLPLSALGNLAARFRDELSSFGPPPYIGVTWRAGIQKFNRLSKIGPPDAIARAMKDIAGTVVVLQRNPLPDEIDRFANCLGRAVCDMTTLNDDLEGMLALLGQLDDYVCVSNTNVHLRVGLGRTCRVLVPYPADYRWMKEGNESPWFPGSAVYRETPGDGWGSALERLAADLATAFR